MLCIECKTDIYTKFFKNIPENAKVCIYGSNSTAEKLFDELKEKRSDVEVKFFIDSKQSGTLKGLPLYLAQNLDEHLEEIDTAIAASYSNRFYMEFILKEFGIKNILLIPRDIIVPENQEQQKEWDVEKSAEVFKTNTDRKLYRFMAKARHNRKKYLPKIKKYYDKKHSKRIGVYSVDHYFEFINRNAIEVAIDGGGYNCIHSLMMLQMFPNCKKVYTFEPCYDSFKSELLDKLIKKRNEIEIIKKALWKENTQLSFREEFNFKVGSAIVEVKPNIEREHKLITVDAITIDSFVEQNNISKIDFIKMDLENAEMDALKGAEKVILKYRPQLAISIYHSNEHFYNIPLYLQNLLDNYEFRLGHYRDSIGETVLYAIPEELVK